MIWEEGRYFAPVFVILWRLSCERRTRVDDMKLLWNKAQDGSPVLILAHGAGAGMDSEFMEAMAGRLCSAGVTVVRFEFDYMQQRWVTGKKRPPDRQPKLLECWQKVLKRVVAEVKAPVYIGGKSMGGRIATLLAAGLSEEWPEQLPEDSVHDVAGVVCLGYPFYAPGKLDKPRIEHLETLTKPTLILQGERDTMGNREEVERYGLSSSVRIEWLADGNHDLNPRVRSGHTHDGHLQFAVRAIHEFCVNNTPIGDNEPSEAVNEIVENSIRQ